MPQPCSPLVIVYTHLRIEASSTGALSDYDDDTCWTCSMTKTFWMNTLAMGAVATADPK